MSQNSSQEKIGVITATIVGMNAMIGAGIFTIPAALTTNIGPVGMISFLLVAFGAWALAQSFARVAQLSGKEGSFYSYASLHGNHRLGTIANGSYLIGLLIAMGLLAQAAGSYLYKLVPYTSPHTLSIIILGVIVLLNMKGAQLSKLGQNILIMLTVFPLIAITILCLRHADFSNLVPFAPYGITPVFSQMDIVIFSFFGFESAASLFNVIKNPEKNLPKAITFSVVVVAIIYLAFVASLLLAIPSDIFKTFAGQPLPVILQYIFPNHPLLLTTIHISSLSAILGTLHSMIWGSGNLLYSFAQKARNLPIQLLLASRIIRPTTCFLLVGLGIFISCNVLHDNAFFAFTALFLLVAYMLSIFPLLSIKHEWQSGKNYITLAAIFSGCVIAFFALKNIFSSFFIS